MCGGDLILYSSGPVSEADVFLLLVLHDTDCGLVQRDGVGKAGSSGLIHSFPSFDFILQLPVHRDSCHPSSTRGNEEMWP